MFSVFSWAAQDFKRMKYTLAMFLCKMSEMTAYMLRKSSRFRRETYNCLSSCSFRANWMV